MIIRSTDKHLTDQEFFTFVKFFEFIIEKKELSDKHTESFKLSDIDIGSDDMGYVFGNIFTSGQALDISIGIEKGYKFDEEIENAKKGAENNPAEEKEKLLKIINNIQNEQKIKFIDANDVSWVWYEVYDRVRFTPSEYKIPKEIKESFRMEIAEYLDNFINDKLAITKKNYYTFETQKKFLIKLIEEDKKITLYGNNFIIKERIDNDCVSRKTPEFCIIHTVYALQKLGYLKVVNIWEEKEYLDPNELLHLDDSVPYINVNIILEDTFIREINNKYKKDNPKNIFEEFDEKTGILKFAGQKIELSKKGKETDAVLLMKTLLKVENDDWKHNDEILEDWGYNDEDQKDTPKNKVYFAGQKINNAIALKTQIDDFIECNTSKARINPKYRKIDE
jgi:hypothetical protein